MDADSEERQRDRISRRARRRWSMNSQRLEQIVAELMRPIGDLRRSFDTDLSALLEEYLTEAGLHALEEGERSPDSAGGAGGAGGAAPNFAELALLLQQSANIYGRKVDFLYQHVLEVSESLHLSTNELSQSTTESPAAAATPSARRRRRASAALGWARISLEAAAGARREAELRPPPTLPRLYADLAPRVLTACDAPLADYAGEPVGLLQDFHVTWRLHGGLLVDELECGSAEAAGALRAIPLAELQAAIEAAAPPSPPPPPEPEPPDDARLATSTPLPKHPEEPPPLAPLTSKLEGEAPLRRKRRPDEPLAPGAAKLRITPELLAFLHAPREFSVCADWVARVVAARRARLRAARAARAALPRAPGEFRGFDTLDKCDINDSGGFPGFHADSSALSALSALSRLCEDSDDDGFFEQSELGSEGSGRLELSRSPPPAAPPPPPPVVAEEPAWSAGWAAWRAGVVARAAAGEARGLDVRALGRAVLAALPPLPPAPPAAPAPPAPPAPFRHVLRVAARDHADVSRLFLASLFLANAGNVELVPGPALALDSFALRLVSADERRYCAAAAADPAFLAR